MEQLALSDQVTPFWHRFDTFFYYPFKPGNLLFLLLSLLLLFLVPLPNRSDPISVIGLIYRIFVWILYPSFIFSYLSSVTLVSIDGGSEAPDIMQIWKDGGFLIFLKALVIVALFGSVQGAARLVGGEFLGNLFTLFAVFSFPAALILFATERKISAAVNPRKIAFVVTAIGWPYGMLWALMMLLVSAPKVLDLLPETVLHSTLAVPMSVLVIVYFGLVIFHMLGYVVYQYHFELGLALGSDQIAMEHRRDHHPAITEAELLIVEGQFNSARSILQHWLKKNPRDSRVWQMLHRLARTTLKDEAQLEIEDQYLGYLLKDKQRIQAVGLIRHLLKNNIDLTHFQCVSAARDLLAQEHEHELIEKMECS